MERPSAGEERGPCGVFEDYDYCHSPFPPCKLCGGNAGGLSPNRAHYLCEARAALGLPTPCLGMRCPDCKGVGTKGKGGVMLFLDIGPAAIKRSLDAQFPLCTTCKGMGSIGKS